MVEGDAPHGADDGLFPARVGDRLRAARVAAEMDLNDVAGKTRIPTRHLEAIERSDYSALPSPTYALGFARSFARAVGADDVALARDLRGELGRAPPEANDAQPYEPTDPARVPSRMLAWVAATIGVLLVSGYLYLSNQRLDAPVAAPAIEQPGEPVVAAEPVATPAPVAAGAGAVVLTSTEPVWVRIYDKADVVLLQKEMGAGETYAVPATADTPMIRTARANVIKVTIDGRDVAPLGPPEQTIRDVVLTASALQARGGDVMAPVAANGTAL